MERFETSEEKIESAGIGLTAFLDDYCNKSEREVRIRCESLKVAIIYFQADPSEISRVFLNLREQLISLKSELTPDSDKTMIFCYHCMAESILRCLPEQIANRLEIVTQIPENL